LIQKIISFLNKGNARSVRAKKQVLQSFFFQGSSILLGFLLVPITLEYLGNDKATYGVWMNISDVIAWFNFFDIGLGNGMRNKFAEAKARGEDQLARTYVSTTYIGLGVIMSIVFLIILISNPFINWQVVFNTDIPEWQLELTTMIVFGFFCVRFVIQLVEKLLIADQKPSWSKGFKFFANVISLSVIYLLTLYTEGSIVNLSLVLSLSPILVLGLATIYFYRGEYAQYRPALSLAQREHFKSLMSLGGKFFLLQIGSLILFMTDGFIIAHIPGLENEGVFNYKITRKFFTIPTIAFTIITNTLWSAFTDAYTRNDFRWIKNTIKTSIFIWAGLSVGVVIMIFIAIPFIDIWTKGQADVPFSLVLMMGFFQIIRNLNAIFVTFVNGVGKIKLQIWSAYLAMIINIPLSFFFAQNLGWGLTGVIAATCVSIGIDVIIRPIQYYKIINGKAKGIWNA